MVLLQEGDFESALATIEDGLKSTLEDLPPSEDTQLHESLCPFYYLYGSTLLYSIEESNDPNQQMTKPGEGNEGADGGGEEAAAPTEDIEIAWENLETARTILGRLLEQEPESRKLQADFAQVHLRAADLQRLNGTYDGAVSDYTISLKYRSATELSKWSRKIADIHYNLGLVSFHHVATMNSAKESDPNADLSLLEATRARGFKHYYECATTFGGIVAELCGADPDELVQQAENSVPNFKSTGEDAEDEKEGDVKMISLKLEALRKCIAELDVNDDAKLDVDNIVSVLDEIQETIDEAESSEQGMQEVTSMKEQITAMVAAQGDDTEEASSSTGFGSAAAAVSTATAQPLMVKKKKKRTDADASAAEPAAKKPKASE